MRGEKRNYLAENGLSGKIQFSSTTSAQEMIKEICQVFTTPMGLSTSKIEEGKTFNFIFLQHAGVGSCTLCRPSVADTFEWNGKHVAISAKSGSIIYIQALDELAFGQVN